MPSISPPSKPGHDERISLIDVRLRVIAIALEPALVLARVVALPLDDLQELVAVGFFRETRARGLSLGAVANRFQKSLRTVKSLSKRAASETRPLAASQRLTWRRRVAELVSAGAGLRRDDLVRALPDAPPAEIDAALDQLVDEGILARDGELALVDGPYLGLVRQALDQRLDSLRHFLTATTQVIYRRFFGGSVPPDDADAFARVLTFRASRPDLGTIRDKAYDTLRSEVLAADSRAQDDPDAPQASVVLALVQTPTDPFWRPRRS
ncbi:MAG: hypothetical protein IT379_11445 [Deltaproteobacteria bacterium]|nr:hypothetical protein [Deltaproteobacteria bacterium]